MKTKIFNFFRTFFLNKFAENMIIWLINQTRRMPITQKIAPNHYQYPKGSIRECERYGIKLVLDISDYLEHFIYFNFTDISINKLLSVISNGMYFIDVGANIGYTSMRAYNKTKGDIHIYAFEPDSMNYYKLIQNLKLNPNVKIDTFNIALGESEYFATLIMPTQDNRGGIRINNIRKNSVHEKTLIKVVPLDNFVIKDNIINKVDLIKIDVEGFELKVLKGAKETLSRFQPILFIEWDNANLTEQEDTVYELFTFVKKYNYSIFDTNTNIEITDKNIKNFENIHTDILCIPIKK